MKNIKINFAENEKNIIKFKKHQFDGTIKYTCVNCSRKDDIFHMVSDNGNRMICTLCAKKYFGCPLKAIDKFCLNRGDKHGRN